MKNFSTQIYSTLICFFSTLLASYFYSIELIFIIQNMAFLNFNKLINISFSYDNLFEIYYTYFTVSIYLSFFISLLFILYHLCLLNLNIFTYNSSVSILIYYIWLCSILIYFFYFFNFKVFRIIIDWFVVDAKYFKGLVLLWHPSITQFIQLYCFSCSCFVVFFFIYLNIPFVVNYSTIDLVGNWSLDKPKLFILGLVSGFLTPPNLIKQGLLFLILVTLTLILFFVITIISHYQKLYVSKYKK